MSSFSRKRKHDVLEQMAHLIAISPSSPGALLDYASKRPAAAGSSGEEGKGE